ARALALVSARELDELECKRLEPLVAKGADATSLRLRAELALRRADDKSVIAIGTFASEAPDDPRSARYQGWLFASKGKYGDAAKQLEKAGAKRELARVLAAAKDMQAALARVDGEPTTAEELALVGQIALAAGKLPDAERALVAAERLAPASPVVQAALLALGARQNDKQRVDIATLISGIALDLTTITEAKPRPSVGSPRVGSAPDKVTIDLAGTDARILEPMLEALALAQHAKSKLVIAELAAQPSLFAVRITHPELVRDALVKLLSAPPYDMQVLAEPRVLEGKTVELGELTRLTGELDGALIYRVEAAGGDAKITLVHFARGATQATQVSREVDMAGVVTFNIVKLVVVIGVVLVVVLLVVLWFTRSMGKVELQIARTSDADEALCVEITKNPKRPPILDMLAFHNATKAAGAVTRRREAKLIASGATFRVPTGSWYVHLYGTYSHAGKLRLVPESCTREIEVRRGVLVEVAFDLIAKVADVTLDIVYQPRTDIVVWANHED
ncbi:MAG TPA: hypothetical protein VK427_13655, partial [Kofleriaceae bacterium]|nr:hypothetical protein [Kofleriaceae bacterium]